MAAHSKGYPRPAEALDDPELARASEWRNWGSS